MLEDRESVDRLLDRMAGVGLLVIGDFMVDRTVYGEAGRISPEAPTPVVLLQDIREQLGGAGNVVRNLDSLGGKIWCAAVTGEDEAGEWLERELHSLEGCQAAQVCQEPGRRTTLKTRIVAVQPGRVANREIAYGYQQMMRLDQESRHPIRPETAARLFNFASDVIGEVDGVLISDYAKGTLPAPFVRQLIEMARKADKHVFVDPKAKEFLRYSGASVITPNAMEAEAALGISFTGAGDRAAPDWEKSVRDQLELLNVGTLLVTRGAEGLSIFDRQGCHHFPTTAREVVDVTGAGDTLIASFALAVASGAPCYEAAQLGNLAAGVAVGKAGAAVVHPYEIERELDGRHASWQFKLRTREEIKTLAETLHREDKKIVFTNGCFDLLHIGHMHLLREAKTFGDVLIVGLNSDASVKRLKGENRPVIPGEDRANAIAALECVDYVVIFDEPDPMALLQQICPDVLVKGSDYNESQVVGAEFLKSYGGVTRLVPIRCGISTSRIIEKIRCGSL